MAALTLSQRRLSGASFASQLQAFADKTGEKLENVDRAFKLGMFQDVVKRTRVADPSTWKRPDPTYLGGTMRGNWFVSTGAPVSTFVDGLRNTSAAMPAGEASKIQPFSATWLTNNTPYVMVYEEKDGMVGAAIANARRRLEQAVKSVR